MNGIDPSRVPPVSGKPMVAIPIVRTQIELNARTLAASALCEVGIDRTPDAMDWLTEYLLDKAAMGCAVWHEAHKSADAGDAITKLKQSPPGD